MKRGAFIVMAILSLLAFLSGCFRGEDRVAGGGGVDVEGFTVEGTALRPDGSPIAAAQVRLRPWDFRKGKGAPKRAIDHGDAATDSLGRFRFADVDTGRYALEVDAGAEGATTLEIEVDGSRRVTTIEARVSPRGVLAGTVRDDSGRAIPGAIIGLLGLDRNAASDSAGAFRLDAIPAGTYTAHVQPPGPPWSAVDIPMVVIRSDTPAVLDAVLPAAVPGLMAHWRFDEGKGAVAADALGSDARAILRGSAAFTSGRDGMALSLAKSGDYAFVPKTKSSGLDLPAGSAFTVTAWVRTAPGSAGSVRRIADAHASYDPSGWSLGLDAGGGAEFYFQAAGQADTSRLAGGPSLDDGAWHHLAAGRSGTRWFIYVDGLLIQTAPGPDGPITRANAVWFGCREGKADFLAGTIDDVRLYARGLDSAEALSLAR